MLEERGTSEEVTADTLEWYQDNIIDHAEDLIKYRSELLALAEAQKAEAKRFTDSAKAKELQAERIMQDIDQAMQLLGKKEVQAGLFKLKYKKGSKVTEVDTNLLPKQFWASKIVETPMSKPELKKLVDAGEVIAGVTIVQNPDKLEIKL
jgi:sulfur carrier protein ThiS